MPPPTVIWSFADLVDFEVLLAQDEIRQNANEQPRLEERDRRIAREIADRPTPTSPAPVPLDRRFLFRAWLDRRLAHRRSNAEFTAGAATALALTLSSLILAGVGFLSGKAILLLVLTGAGLRSTQDEPVNVLFYLVACIFPQALLALGAVGLMLAQSRMQMPTAPPALRGLLTLLVRPLFAWLLGRLGHSSVAGATRQDLAAAMGWLRGRSLSHAEALRWPLISLFHSFALGYAVAILVGTLLSAQIWHQTFAWQTTVQAYTPERIHRLVQVIAIPWSWALPEGSGYPSREAVAMTRFHRHQDPAALPPDATSSWWLFVVLAALSYGFLPRLFLWLWSKAKLRSALRRETFDTLALDPLYERLARPHVAWHGPDTPAPPSGHCSSTPSSAEPDARQWASPGPATLLVPVEISSTRLFTTLREKVQSSNGWELQHTVELDGNAAGHRALVNPDASSEKPPPTQRVLILQEAFMPPTREVLNSFRDLRQAVGPQARILIGLIGKPGSEPLGQPISTQQLEVWRQQVRSLGDSNLQVQPVLAP
jgi:hypothetical protein